MWRCAACGVPVTPGCPEVRGADGFVSAEADAAGVVQARAYHWRRECSGIELGRRRTAPLRLLRFAPPAEPAAAPADLSAAG